MEKIGHHLAQNYEVESMKSSTVSKNMEMVDELRSVKDKLRVKMVETDQHRKDLIMERTEHMALKKQ